MKKTPKIPQPLSPTLPLSNPAVVAGSAAAVARKKSVLVVAALLRVLVDPPVQILRLRRILLRVIDEVVHQHAQSIPENFRSIVLVKGVLRLAIVLVRVLGKKKSLVPRIV